MIRPLQINERRFDVVVIGAGLAGLLTAIGLAEKSMKVVLLAKTAVSESNSSWAQGGLAAVTGDNPADTPQSHVKDTLDSGAGLCDERIVRIILEDAWRLVNRLELLGVDFDRLGPLRDLAREGGHSHARVLHNKDSSGKAITAALIAACRSQPHLTILERTHALELIVSGDRCAGVLAHDGTEVVSLRGSSVVLATGGVGQLFERTTNPAIATGDGIVMAYRAGVELVDMEFVQFHPTALAVPGAPAALITEAVRGAGAHLVDSRGQRFVLQHHKDGELATRDVVSRAIYAAMHDTGNRPVYLDLRPIGATKILDRFPGVMSTCRNWGIDPLEELIPVAPAAHYFMGGVRTDEWGATTLAGLYAVGECASTGLHGANRLASNSLLEAGVMAIRTADCIAGGAGLSGAIPESVSPATLPADRRRAAGRSPASLSVRFPRRNHPSEELDHTSNGNWRAERVECTRNHDHRDDNAQPQSDMAEPTVEHCLLSPFGDADDFIDRLRREMSTSAGVVRTASRLNQLIESLAGKVDEDRCLSSRQVGAPEPAWRDFDAGNFARLSYLIASAALVRCESRGTHWREETPHTRPEFRRRYVQSRRGAAWIEVAQHAASTDEAAWIPPVSFDQAVAKP